MPVNIVAGGSTGSVATNIQGSVAVVIIGGSIAASFTPPANQSVSGTVQTDVRGSVAVAIISGSISATFTPPANQSVSGTVNIGTGGPVSVTGTMSVLGTVPVTQSTSPWIITGSVQGSFSPSANQSVSGTVTAGSVLAIPGIVSTSNSTSTNQIANSVFTGVGEEWKDFGTITVNVFADAASATDGLSIQQSSNNTNWDIVDTYTIPSMIAGQGKTFGVQPAARFGRVVYTNGASASGQLRLQTVYHPQFTKPSSQRPSDAYTNETDLEQVQSFGQVFNGTTWDRQRGNATNGTLMFGSVQAALTTGAAVIGSVAALQGTNPWIVTSSVAGGLFPISGSVAATITNTNVNVSGSVAAFVVGSSSIITRSADSSVLSVPVGSTIVVLQSPSIVGTYSVAATYAATQKAIATMGIRNDTLASIASSDLGYTLNTIGPAGEFVSANAPFTKWVQGTADFRQGNAGASILVIANGTSSIFQYITGVQIANMGSASVLVTLAAGGSTLGYSIAPAGGGSNIYYPNALKTPGSFGLAASISGIASVLVSAQGFLSKT